MRELQDFVFWKMIIVKYLKIINNKEIFNYRYYWVILVMRIVFQIDYYYWWGYLVYIL